ncbi:MAG: PIN domain-containing protein [Pseudomonadota bacterium]
MKYLLDSNIVVAAIKGRLPVAVRLSSMRPGDIAVPIIAKMEAEMALRADTRAQNRYGKLLREFFANVRVLDFGAAEAQHAITLGGYQRQGGGAPMDNYNLLVAATALAHQLVLVTDDTLAFADVPGLDVENWLRNAA